PTPSITYTLSLHDALPISAALFEHQNDLYYCNLDGSGAVRLTKTPGAKELATFSPDGKFVAFVRGNNLNVVDIATQTERALPPRSEEHTSELQSRFDLVCR